VERPWRGGPEVATLLPVFVGVRRLGLALGLLGVLATAVGCGGGGSRPRPLPPLTATTPAAVTTQAPAHSRAADLAAATAVVRSYFAAKNQLSRGMNESTLASLSTSRCPCRSLLRDVRRVRSNSQTYFGRATLTNVTPTRDGPASIEVLVTYNSTAGGTRTSDGRVLYKGPAHHLVKQVFYLALLRGRWLIDNIVLLDAGNTG
jgi:hypothetical protein